MTREFDIIIIGAGPAGMSAAIVLREQGLSVLVVDEQPAPGGQIWRAVERVASTSTGKLLGNEYRTGQAVVEQFHACGAQYQANTQVWQIEAGWHVYMTCDGKVELVQAQRVLLAMGAQERPAPFEGWTLPGVLTVGAAQILLKTSNQVPTDPVWVVGSGLLTLLYMAQLLRAGGAVAGWLDTSPKGSWRNAFSYISSVFSRWHDVHKGLSWLRELRRAGVKRFRGVASFRTLGDGRVQALEYTLENGLTKRVDASVILVHEGLVPSVHMTRALGCEHVWNDAQASWMPALDDWGQTSVPGIYVAGDGASIGGADAACTHGQIVALGIAMHAGKLPREQADVNAKSARQRLHAQLQLRPMLDKMYPPYEQIFNPADDTIVCRCEELTAGDIRRAAKLGQPGPNQIKAFTRAGMGPCQGRQCGYTIANILAREQGCTAAEVGVQRVRPPIKPLTLGQLASFDIEGDR